MLDVCRFLDALGVARDKASDTLTVLYYGYGYGYGETTMVPLGTANIFAMIVIDTIKTFPRVWTDDTDRKILRQYFISNGINDMW